MASKSRFFAESDSESEEEVVEVVEAAKKVGGRFKVMEESDSDDEEERVVRSEKSKKFEALLTIVTAIRNNLRNNDFPAIQDGECCAPFVCPGRLPRARRGHPRGDPAAARPPPLPPPPALPSPSPSFSLPARAPLFLAAFSRRPGQAHPHGRQVQRAHRAGGLPRLLPQGPE